MNVAVVWKSSGLMVLSIVALSACNKGGDSGPNSGSLTEPQFEVVKSTDDSSPLKASSLEVPSDLASYCSKDYGIDPRLKEGQTYVWAEQSLQEKSGGGTSISSSKISSVTSDNLVVSTTMNFANLKIDFNVTTSCSKSSNGWNCNNQYGQFDLHGASLPTNSSEDSSCRYNTRWVEGTDMKYVYELGYVTLPSGERVPGHRTRSESTEINTCPNAQPYRESSVTVSVISLPSIRPSSSTNSNYSYTNHCYSEIYSRRTKIEIQRQLKVGESISKLASYPPIADLGPYPGAAKLEEALQPKKVEPAVPAPAPVPPDTKPKKDTKKTQ